MTDKTFTIEVTMNERWINNFCSMLKYMEKCGNMGHSEIVSFYADGDGDFRPHFNIDTNFNLVPAKSRISRDVTILYDAG